MATRGAAAVARARAPLVVRSRGGNARAAGVRRVPFRDLALRALGVPRSMVPEGPLSDVARRAFARTAAG